LKPTLAKILFFLFYILLLLWIIKFDLTLIINPKSFFMVVLGTALLSLFGYKKHCTKSVLINQIKWNQLTGYLITFMSQMAFLSEQKSHLESDIFLDICLNFIPLVYAYLIYAVVDFYDNIIQNDKHNSTSTNMKNTEIIPSTTQNTANADSIEGIDVTKLMTEKINALLDEFYLTKTEKAVSEYVLRGLTNKEISNALYISENTVKKHIQNILRKSDTKNRNQFICKINTIK